MSAVAVERVNSRKVRASRDGKNSSIELLYYVSGASNEDAVRRAAEVASPPTWVVDSKVLWRQAITIEVVGTENQWGATVYYDSSIPATLAGPDSFEYSTRGGSQTITQSLATVAIYPGGGPNFQGAIGVTDSGVEGAEIVVPVITFTETHLRGSLSTAYKNLLEDYTATVNQFPFRGRAGGEVLFLGASARKENNQTSTPWVVTYEFAVSKNRTSFLVGGIAVAAKAGWDYMWVRYMEIPGSNQLVRVPSSVHIEQVYEVHDFSNLGIGV